MLPRPRRGYAARSTLVERLSSAQGPKTLFQQASPSLATGVGEQESRQRLDEVRVVEKRADLRGDVGADLAIGSSNLGGDFRAAIHESDHVLEIVTREDVSQRERTTRAAVLRSSKPPHDMRRSGPSRQAFKRRAHLLFL
jgi:hypothetical protein